MKFSKKQLPKSEIAVEVELTPEELEKHRQKSVELLAKEIKLEGFRPGHVPSSVAEQRLSGAEKLAEMARLAIGEAWANIVEQEALDVIGEPRIEVTKLAEGNPLEFRVTVAQLPELTLPDYQEIAKKSAKRNVAVEEKEVDDAVTWLRESRKTKDGVTPEVTNEFAQGLGNFSDMAGLRESIKDGLLHEKEMQEKDRVRQEIVEKVAEETQVEVPEVLVEREKQVLLSQLQQGVAQTLQMSFEDYLQKAKKTEQEVMDSFTKEAEKRVKRFLVLREVAKKEQINPTQEEIEKEAQTILEHYKNTQQAKQDIDPARLKEYTEGVLRHEKTLQFLEQFASQSSTT